jgi:hypothetical protein
MKTKTKLNFEQRAELERILEFSCDEEELSDSIALLISERDRLLRAWKAAGTRKGMKGTTA